MLVKFVGPDPEDGGDERDPSLDVEPSSVDFGAFTVDTIEIRQMAPSDTVFHVTDTKVKDGFDGGIVHF